MSFLCSASRLLSAFPYVAARRALRGPALDSRSLRTEAIAQFLRWDSDPLRRASVEELRRVREGNVMRSPAILLVKSIRAVVGGVPGEWVSPRQSPAPRVFLYLHGGAFLFGSANTHRDLAARVALAANARVFVAEYRLAPEHPFPAAQDDALAAYQGILDAGTPPGRVFVAGDSAGGNLALSLLYRLREQGKPQPAGAALLSPWLDLRCDAPSYERNRPFDFGDQKHLAESGLAYAGGRALTDPMLSPGLGSLENLAPLLLQVGSAEMLFDECETFAEKARSARAQLSYSVYPGMFHVWHFFAIALPEAQRAFEEIGAFARAHDRPNV
jgi:acetyl esterase/lipase